MIKKYPYILPFYLVLAGLVLWGSTGCGSFDLDSKHYFCKTDQECAGGYVCDTNIHTCVRPGEITHEDAFEVQDNQDNGNEISDSREDNRDVQPQKDEIQNPGIPPGDLQEISEGIRDVGDEGMDMNINEDIREIETKDSENTEDFGSDMDTFEEPDSESDIPNQDIQEEETVQQPGPGLVIGAFEGGGGLSQNSNVSITGGLCPIPGSAGFDGSYTLVPVLTGRQQ